MFKRKKKLQTLNKQTSLFHQIGSRILIAQKNWASWMHRKTRHWKQRQQKVFLFILCLILGGTSTYRIIELFADCATPAAFNVVKQQPLPPMITPPEPDKLPLPTDTMVFYRFWLRMDSLLKTPEGQKKYVQFLKERPGFLDSLAFAEKISKQSFPNQLKK